MGSSFGAVLCETLGYGGGILDDEGAGKGGEKTSLLLEDCKATLLYRVS